MPDIAKLEIEVSAKGLADARRALDDLAKAAGLTEKSGKTLMDRFRDLQAVMMGPVAAFNQVVGIFKKAAAGAQELVDIYARQEQAVATLEAVYRSTGGAVGISTDALQEMAAALQKVTVFGDEQIIKMQSVLMGFRSVSGPVFEEATEAILNMSTVMGTDLVSGANMLGKALDSPVEGMSALSRVGFVFTEEQKKLAEQLQNSGDLMGAQRIILDEMEKAFGGAARAVGETSTGAFKKFGNALGDLKEEFGQTLADGLAPFVNWMTEAVTKMTEAAGAANNLRMVLAGGGSASDAIKAKAQLEKDIQLLLDKQKASARGLSQAEETRLWLAQQQLQTVTQIVEQNRLIAMYAQRSELAAPKPAAAAAEDPQIKGRKDALKATEDAIAKITLLSQNRAITEEEAARRVAEAYRKEQLALIEIGYSITDNETLGGRRLQALNWYLENVSTTKAAITYADTEAANEAELNAKRQADRDAEERIRLQMKHDQKRKMQEMEAAWAEEEMARMVAFEVAIQRIGSAIDNAAGQAYLKGFETLGELLVKGELSADNFAAAMADVGIQLLNQLPMLFLSAGLQAIVMGNVPLGLGLIALSGLTAFASGAAKAGQGASKSAHGNVFGWEGMQAFAQGGAFTNSIVDKPTYFRYGGGFLGQMGEAGPEAIMPLTRLPNGNLGVEAAGAGGGAPVIIQIIDQTGGKLEKTTQEGQGPNGEKIIKVIIREAVRESLARGEMDGPMAGRYGVRPVGVARS